MSDRTTIVLADDHPAFRNGIKAALQQTDRFDIVAECSNGLDALEQVRQLAPQILLLDMSMPLLNGLEVAESLLNEGSTTIVLPLSGHSDAEFVLGVLEKGAQGYIMKDEPVSVIIAAIDRTLGGGVFISSRVNVELISQQKKQKRAQNEIDECYQLAADLNITPRLLLILQETAHGKTNEDIAAIVYRSEHTVRNQIETLKSITGVRWRPALVSWAWKNDIMSIDLDLYEAHFKRVN